MTLKPICFKVTFSYFLSSVFRNIARYMKSITIESIEKFIFEGRVDAALDYMIIATKDLIKNDDLLQDLTLLKSRYSSIKDENKKGTIKFEDYNVAFSKIIESVIEAKKVLENEMSTNTVNEKLQDVELELLIYTNAYANTIKDIMMVEKTIHSKIKEEIIKGHLQTFENTNLNLEYIIESIEIIEIGEEFATAHVVQITKDKTPSFFRNNKSKSSHTFLKENGRWKFFNSIIQEIKYL